MRKIKVDVKMNPETIREKLRKMLNRTESASSKYVTVSCDIDKDEFKEKLNELSKKNLINTEIKDKNNE